MSKIVVGNRKDQEIKELYKSTYNMLEQVRKMLDMALVLTESQDSELALNILEEDNYLDEMQSDFILNINSFILREQPKAKDLRVALAMYAISYDIERVGDYFKNYAKAIIKTKIEKESIVKNIITLLEILKSRLDDTKEAIKSSNHELAKNIARRDVEIDTLVKELLSTQHKEMRNDPDKTQSRDISRMIIIFKGFERAGDHLVNICEQISFIERGTIYHYN